MSKGRDITGEVGALAPEGQREERPPDGALEAAIVLGHDAHGPRSVGEGRQQILQGAPGGLRGAAVKILRSSMHGPARSPTEYTRRRPRRPLAFAQHASPKAQPPPPLRPAR